MAVLQQISGTPPLPTHGVSDDLTIIGRHEDCQVVVESPSVSRHHAQITCDNNRYFIEDLNSRNGTVVNGKRIQERTLLTDGDQIQICSLPFTFLTQNSLTGLSGSWGVKPDVISVSRTGSDQEDSIRRQIVRPGDRISQQLLGTDPIRESQIVARIHVADGGGGWPVILAAVEKLNHVLRLVHSLRGMVSREDVITHTLEVLFEVFPSAERIAIVLRDEHGSGIQVEAAAASEKTQEIEVCLPLIRTAMQGPEALLYIDHLRNGDTQNEDPPAASIRSILASPLVGLTGRSIGAIQVDSNNRRDPLEKADVEKLVVLSHIVSFALEQSFSIEAAIEQAVTDKTVANAGRLQACLLPAESPDIPGYRMGYRLTACSDIAADLVDYVRLPHGKIACILIDVPGRGLEAASLMALLSRLLTQAVIETGSPAKSIAVAENELRLKVTSVPTVISVAVMMLDPARCSVTLATAGHCPAVLLRQNELRELQHADNAGPAMGLSSGPGKDTEIPMDEDDVLVVFSDGIRKLTSPNGETLSQPELLSMVRQACDAPRSVFENRLDSLLTEYRGDTQLMDDVAFVMIQRTTGTDTVDSSLTPPAKTTDS